MAAGFCSCIEEDAFGFEGKAAADLTDGAVVGESSTPPRMGNFGDNFKNALLLGPLPKGSWSPRASVDDVYAIFTRTKHLCHIKSLAFISKFTSRF